MKLAIHHTKTSFSERWIPYCESKGIDFKIVDCYKSNIIDQLSDCDGLMWHHSQNNPGDLLIAKQILYALEQSGKIVFPNFNTNWHFDDKVGQKYLLEASGLPIVESYSFFSKIEAIEFAKKTTYPMVFKLRGGAGSFNVKLVKNFGVAKQLIKKAFGKGFSNFDSYENFNEVYRKWKLKKVSLVNLMKASARFFIKPEFSKVAGREYGYIYFQEFIPNCDYDIRVIVIDGKAFAIKRLVRKNDFRASGSGYIEYQKEHFDDATIQLAFNSSKILNIQCGAFDFVYIDKTPLIVEISYGFSKEGYDSCVGYWDEKMEFYEGKFDPCQWMVDLVVKQISAKHD